MAESGGGPGGLRVCAILQIILGVGVLLANSACVWHSEGASAYYPYRYTEKIPEGYGLSDGHVTLSPSLFTAGQPRGAYSWHKTTAHYVGVGIWASILFIASGSLTLHGTRRGHRVSTTVSVFSVWASCIAVTLFCFAGWGFSQDMRRYSVGFTAYDEYIATPATTTPITPTTTTATTTTTPQDYYHQRHYLKRTTTVPVDSFYVEKSSPEAQQYAKTALYMSIAFLVITVLQAMVTIASSVLGFQYATRHSTQYKELDTQRGNESQSLHGLGSVVLTLCVLAFIINVAGIVNESSNHEWFAYTDIHGKPWKPQGNRDFYNSNFNVQDNPMFYIAAGIWSALFGIPAGILAVKRSSSRAMQDARVAMAALFVLMAVAMVSIAGVAVGLDVDRYDRNFFTRGYNNEQNRIYVGHEEDYGYAPGAKTLVQRSLLISWGYCMVSVLQVGTSISLLVCCVKVLVVTRSSGSKKPVNSRETSPGSQNSVRSNIIGNINKGGFTLACVCNQVVCCRLSCGKDHNDQTVEVVSTGNHDNLASLSEMVVKDTEGNPITDAEKSLLPETHDPSRIMVIAPERELLVEIDGGCPLTAGQTLDTHDILPTDKASSVIIA